MKLLIYIIYLPLLYSTATAQRTSLDDIFINGRIFKIFVKKIMNEQSTSYKRSLQASHRIQNVISDSTPFPCSINQSRSKEKPNTVHMLRPGDIDVVGAIGDSLTAGYGAMATNIFNILQEYRGVSFPIGGQKTWREYLTIPNILKVYNPNLIGYSIATSFTKDKESKFNVAENGAMTSDITYMTKVLIKRITSDEGVNLADDWKMITIFIGANDFCLQSCYESNPTDILVRHKENLIQVLRLLRDNLPRTFVNLISPPYVNILKNFSKLPDTCYITQRISCPCFIGEQFKSLTPKLVYIITEWKKLEREIADYKEFDRDDFTIVSQPLFEEPVLPTLPNGDVDHSYFSVDCFHFSQKGHALVANALWNNILSPVGQKQKTIYSQFLKCPTDENPYLFTKRNSEVL